MSTPVMSTPVNRALLKLKVQVLVGEAIAIGPGKAALLAAIDDTGSIAAAGRAMGLSYRRTRDMIDTLNTSWQEPLVNAAKGGRSNGGAVLTATGREVLARYAALEAAIAQAAQDHADALLCLCRP